MDWIFFLLKKQIPFRPIKILCFETKVTTSMCNIKSVERIPINLFFQIFKSSKWVCSSADLQLFYVIKGDVRLSYTFKNENVNISWTGYFLSETDKNCCQKIKKAINIKFLQVVVYANYACNNKTMPFNHTEELSNCAASDVFWRFNYLKKYEMSFLQLFIEKKFKFCTVML